MCEEGEAQTVPAASADGEGEASLNHIAPGQYQALAEDEQPSPRDDDDRGAVVQAQRESAYAGTLRSWRYGPAYRDERMVSRSGGNSALDAVDPTSPGATWSG